MCKVIEINEVYRINHIYKAGLHDKLLLDIYQIDCRLSTMNSNTELSSARVTIEIHGLALLQLVSMTHKDRNRPILTTTLKENSNV